MVQKALNCHFFKNEELNKALLFSGPFFAKFFVQRSQAFEHLFNDRGAVLCEIASLGFIKSLGKLLGYVNYFGITFLSLKLSGPEPLIENCSNFATFNEIQGLGFEK